jgi:hypothetical protein
VGSSPSSALGVYLVNNTAQNAGDPLQNELSLGGDTFGTEGAFIESVDVATMKLLEDQHGEIEFSLGISSVLDIGDIIEMRVEKSDGTDLTTYTSTPSLAIVLGKLGNIGGAR